MNIYLVGGAVRDKLLDYPVKELDWVVVGSSEQEMLKAGYHKVGRDFPVFLHPKTKEEYALARTERKTGSGYTGFNCNSSTDITLEQDLQRRDLTINAIALTPDGELIDPYGGQADIKKRLLRHVSSAFMEDPLRIIRIARFAARYYHLGFTIADETQALMRQMVDAGEVQHLVAERVWQEMNKALSERNPAEFIHTLKNCGALAVLLPEVDRLFSLSQVIGDNSLLNAGEQALLTLKASVDLSPATTIRFAALMHDVGTESLSQGQHLAHADLKPLRAICKRLKIPKKHTDLATLVIQYQRSCHNAITMNPTQLLQLIYSTDALRRTERFQEFLLVCEAEFKSQAGQQGMSYLPAILLLNIVFILKQLNHQEFIDAGYSGKHLGDKIRVKQVNAIAVLVDKA